MNLEITNVRLHKLNKENSNIKALASIELANVLVIHDIKLIEKEGKRYICFPSKKIRHYNELSEGELNFEYSYTDIVHPSKTYFRQYLQDELFKFYDLHKEEMIDE